MKTKINDLSRIMHWISFLFSRLRFFPLYSSLRRPLDWKRSETIINYKLLTSKNKINNKSFRYMENFEIQSKIENKWKGQGTMRFSKYFIQVSENERANPQ